MCNDPRRLRDGEVRSVKAETVTSDIEIPRLGNVDTCIHVVFEYIVDMLPEISVWFVDSSLNVRCIDELLIIEAAVDDCRDVLGHATLDKELDERDSYTR